VIGAALFAGLLIASAISSFRPATRVRTQTSPPPRSAPTDTGIWFVVGQTEQGPTDPQLIQSLADYQRVYGARVSYGFLYDALEEYFHEGGSSAFISRVVGPNAVIAFKNLLDAGAGVSLKASAIGPGAAGNNLKVAVLAGLISGFRIQVSDASNVVLETSPDLADQQSAISWSQFSSYIRLTLGATALVPAVAAAAALATGTDDRSNITDNEWVAALNRFGIDLGPGQVSAPGRTTDAGHVQLTAHAAAKNRVALLDLPDTATAATLEASALAARSNGDYGGSFSPWINIPGLTSGTLRPVPPSALVAGAIARTDLGGNPNVPAAGEQGESQYALGVTQPAWDDATRDALNSAGVNVIRTVYGGVRIYGWRTLVDAVATPAWISLGNARLRMAIQAQALEILETFLFKQIDGRGYSQADLKAALDGMMQSFFNSGALWGPSPADAWRSDVGNQVNTPTTLANRELHAIISYRDSPFAEFVDLVLVKRAITEAVA